MDDSINVTPFDNEISILYKWAAVLNTPIRYILGIPRIPNDISQLNRSSDVMSEQLLQTNSQTIPNSPTGALLRTLDKFSFESLVSYVQRMILQNIDLYTIYTQLNNTPDLFLLQSQIDEDIAMIYFALQYSQLSETNSLTPQNLNSVLQNINDFYSSIDRNETINDLNELQAIYYDWNRRFNEYLLVDLETLDLLTTLQQELESLERLPMSPIIFDSVIISLRPTLRTASDNIRMSTSAIGSQNSNLNESGTVSLDTDYLRSGTVSLDTDQLLSGTVSLDTDQLLSGTVSLDTDHLRSGTISRSPTADDGIDIFNYSQPTYAVPFIQYNEQLSADIDTSINLDSVDDVTLRGGINEPRIYYRQLFKLFTGTTFETAPNYNTVVQTTIQNNRPNTLYMTVWSGPSDSNNIQIRSGDILRATKESYMRAVYDLNTNELIVRTPVVEGQNENVVVNRISETIPIIPGPISETRVGGSFTIYGVDIIDTTLLDMILNEPLMNFYLYVEESIKPYSRKKRFNIRFKSITSTQSASNRDSELVNPSSVSATLTGHITEEIQVVDVVSENGTLTKVQVPTGTPYINVNITRASSREVAQQFAEILNRLLQFYLRNRAEVEDVYLQFFPNIQFQPKQTSREPALSRRTRGGRKLEPRSRSALLKSLVPDLFVSGYARSCQKRYQPIIISSDQVNEWENTTFIDNGVEKRRQVLRYPPDTPEEQQFIFVCPDDIAPYPGVKLNDLPNRDIYPYIPCCFLRDQMNPNENSLYNEFYRGIDRPTRTRARTGHKIRTDKILKPSKLGLLSNAIRDLLSRYLPTANFYRLGIPHTVNSLLHCVAFAVDDPSYLESETEDEREAYIIRLRDYMASSIYPSLLKQELFDLSESEITSSLFNPDVFLDPSLHYRAVEELFNINIYTFNPPSIEGDPGTLEIPRFRIFHSQPDRPRQCVIILKHLVENIPGQDSALSYPHCELIVDSDPSTNTMTKLFTPDMSTLLHQTFIGMLGTLSWNIETTSQNELNLVARQNLYSLVDYYSLIGRTAISQFIDGYGKLRALLFQSNDQTITMVVPPSQPENLPSVTEPSRPSSDAIISVFGDPIAITKNPDGLVNGLWYSILDLPHGLYFPIQPTSDFSNLPEGPVDPIFSSGINQVSRLQKLRRDLNIILQLVLWLFILFNGPLDTFVDTYFLIGDSQGDSSLIYDFSSISRYLPSVQTPSEAIAIMSQIVPTLFVNDKIYLYSQKFSDGIRHFLFLYQKTHRGLPRRVPTRITRLFQSVSDFISQPHVAIFLSEDDMRSWLTTFRDANLGTIRVRDRLDLSFALLTDPYIYKSPDNKIYQIQNVLTGDILRALNVSLNWSLNKINTGYNSTPVSSSDLPYIVYGISTASTPVLIQNNSGDSEQFLILLSYGSNQYAAMLPLL